MVVGSGYNSVSDGNGGVDDGGSCCGGDDGDDDGVGSGSSDGIGSGNVAPLQSLYVLLVMEPRVATSLEIVDSDNI
jgi:hypothetical protein